MVPRPAILDSRSTMALTEPAPASARREPLGTAASWAPPLMLGLLAAIAAAALTTIELAQPPRQSGFRGIALSNAINSSGSRAGVALFRRHLAWLPYPASGVILSPAHYIWGLRAGIAALAVIQALALVAAIRWPGGPGRWLIGPSLMSIVLLAYPPICTDVFSYASFGWVANRGFDPYLVAPAKLAHDPYAKMNDWTRITTPYGPIWTGISRVIDAVAGSQPFATVIGFKIVIGLAAIALGIVAYAGARRLTPDAGRAAGALVIVAWSPILLLESAGMAHNDAPMMLLAMVGLLWTTSRQRWTARLGIVMIAAAVLIKPAAIPLLGLAALIRLFSGRRSLALLRDLILDFAAVAALTLVAFAPYWSHGRLPRTLWNLLTKLYFEKALHANPLWVWAAPQTARRLVGNAAAVAMKARDGTDARVVVVVFALVALVIALWPRERAGQPASAWILGRQAWAWLAATVGFGLIPVNAQAWYAIWPLAPIALVWAMSSKRRPSLWLGAMMTLMLCGFLVYHTWPFTSHPTAGRLVVSTVTRH